MYFVGIDISKFKHDCVVIDEIGDTILPSWSFINDREGFALLRERLCGLEDEVKIGLEATGHYGQNWESIFFPSSPPQNYIFPSAFSYILSLALT